MLFNKNEKQDTFRIRIENPCHESWDKMTAKEKGRFCGACSKVVVDFNSMTDSQIVAYLTASENSVCGRISKTRIETQFHRPGKNTSVFNFQLLRYSIAGLLALTSVHVSAQQLNIVGQMTVQNDRDDCGMKKKKEEKKPLKGGSLVIDVRAKEGTLSRKSSTITLTCGSWTKVIKDARAVISVPDSLMNKNILVEAYSPGYEYKSITLEMLKNGLKTVIIDLEKQEEMLMGVVVPYND